MNLRGNTGGFPAQGDTPNVTLLSDYSPTAIKLLLDRDSIEQVLKELYLDVKIKNTKNPYTTVCKALDDEDYNNVRKILSESNEELLYFYKAPHDTSVVLVERDNEIDGCAESKSDWEVI